jgi:DNA-binding transcriptional regulator GbsR (MarR family)
MEELLKKAQIDIPKLHRFIKMSAAFELSKLSEPCYYPDLKRTYHELLRQLHISDSDMKALIKRTYEGTRAQSWNLWRSPDHNLMLFIMNIFLRNNNKDAYHAAMIYYMIRQYSHLLNKQMKYCNVEAFKFALETLTKTHLFSREKTIGNSLIHLSNELEKRFTKDIASWNIDKIIDFIGISRHRISQSVKSFAEHYYRAQREGSGIKTQQEPSENDEFMTQIVTLEKGKRVIEETVKKLTMYKTVDRKALEEAKKFTKIKSSISDMLVRSVMNLMYADDIRTILQLFVKDATQTSDVCGKDYYSYVKKLMALKRTRSKVFFKQQVSNLVRKILKENGVLDVYDSYTPQTQFIINSFLALYITMTLRNLIC